MPPRALTLAFLLWAAALLSTQLGRPPAGIDESRYLSVAWEMWQSGDLLVPHLNGELYAEKPPLLFWLIHAGWAVFGVNAAWARLVPALFALGSLLLTFRLARALWPEDPAVARRAPLLLAGGMFWLLFSTALMFDMLVVFFTLAVLLALLRRRHWALVGLLMGIGLLVKGPVILLHTLPMALAATSGRRSRLALSVALGSLIALGWVLAANRSAQGGFMDQIMAKPGSYALPSEEIDHERPFWWYLACLPLMALPWTLWRPLGRAARSLFSASLDGGTRLCLVWAAGSVTLLSLMPAKQEHYVLPALPALALIAGRALQQEEAPHRRRHGIIVGSLIALLGAYTLIQSEIELPPQSGILMVLLGLLVALARASDRDRALAQMAVAGGIFALLIQSSLVSALLPHYDFTPVAQALAEHERRGHPIAVGNHYEGQYQFLGRLSRPLETVPRDHYGDWAAQHPEGVILSRRNPDGWTPPEAPLAVFDTGWSLWRASAYRTEP